MTDVPLDATDAVIMDKQTRDADIVHLSCQAEWRRWLRVNHAKRTEVWLVIRKKHATLDAVTYEEALDEAICFGWIDGKMRSVDDQRYILRFSPRKPGSLWSLSNRERAEKLMRLGRMAKAGLAKVEDAKRNGQWSAAYTSKEAPAIPPDLQAALDQDLDARERFGGLTHSAQTAYVVWVGQAKRPETRKKRIEQVVKQCKSTPSN